MSLALWEFFWTTPWPAQPGLVVLAQETVTTPAFAQETATRAALGTEALGSPNLASEQVQP